MVECTKDEVIVNSFATECFREVADKDYIASRKIYRLGLIEQFQWNALQTIEKYLKAILLYNQVSAKGLGHDIEKSLKRVERINYFELNLSDKERKFITHLNNNAQNRYLEQSSYALGDELLLLDLLVWSVRRYCQVIKHSIKLKGKILDTLPATLSSLTSDYYKENPHKFILIGGYLEQVVKRKKSDPEREALIWENFFFGVRKKKKIKNFTYRGRSVNPPHFRDEARYEILKEFVDFPKRIRRIFENN